MSSLKSILFLLSLLISLSECRYLRPSKEIQMTKPNDNLNGSIEYEMISGSRVLKTSHPSSFKGYQIKVIAGSKVRKLLGFKFPEEKLGFKESRTVQELVTMDYQGAQRGPSIHNR